MSIMDAVYDIQPKPKTYHQGNLVSDDSYLDAISFVRKTLQCDQQLGPAISDLPWSPQDSPFRTRVF